MTDTLDPLDPSPYKVLNVSKDANLATIRTAHRKLVLITHPDKVQDETLKKARAEQFHQVQQAYEILSDESRRRRWDERARLAELRAEIAEERGPLRRAQTYAAPRPSQGPMFEMRGGRVYEERVPRNAGAYEEDVFGNSFGAENVRSRKYDERYDETPARKTSGRIPDDHRRRYMDVDDEFYDRKAREKRQKEEMRSTHNEKQKQRDKARKKDAEAKFSKKSYVEEESDSDDLDDRHYSSKSDSNRKHSADERKRYRDEPPRRSSKKDTMGDAELDKKIYNVHDYMTKSRESVDSDRKRPNRSRADSYSKRSQLPSPPPTPKDRDYGGRRSSGDDGRRASNRTRTSRPPSPARKPNKSRKNIQTVDEPHSRKASLPTGGSERSGLKSMFSSKREPQRSATFSQESKPPKKPGIQRAETMPIDRMKQERDPRKSSSGLKNMVDPNTFDDVSSSSSDSDSGSDTEDEIPIPKKKTPTRPPLQQQTRYKVNSTNDEKRSPFIVTAEPEEYPHIRSRDVSPKASRRSGDRYGDRARTPPTRASTFQDRPTERPSPRHEHARSESLRQMPPLRTSYSSRDNPKLYGEIDRSPRSQQGSPGIPPRDLQDFSRRGSEDALPRDYYPGSHHRPSRRAQRVS